MLTWANEHMLRYADPRACPDCHTTLPVAPESCPACGLPLRGPLVEELFNTLQHADTLLGRLRLQVPASEPEDVAQGQLPLTPAGSSRRRRGIRTVSVPTILLSLGALCLIVAAITFLVVAWSLMGIGGRTGVLVGLTAAAAASGDWLGRRGLRVAAESLTTVALGLVALDVSGAISAGWLGSPGLATSVILVSAGVAVVAASMMARQRLLFAPQVGVALGLWFAALGTAESTEHGLLVAFGATLLIAGVAVVGRAVGARVLEVSAAIAAGLWWLWLLLGGIEEAVTHPTLHSLWVDTNGLPLLGAALLLLLPLTMLPRGSGWARGCVAGAGTLVTLAVAMPALDEDGTAVAATSLAALVAWSGIALALPRAWRAATAGPLALAALPALGFSAALFADAAVRLLTVGRAFEHSVGVRLAAEDAVASPLLLVPMVVALLVAAWVLRSHAVVPVVGAVVPVVGAPLTLLAACATLVSYGVPLALVVAVPAVAALLVGAIVGARTEAVVAAVVLSVVAIGCALPSAGLTAAACAVAVAVGVLLLRSAIPLPGLLVPAAAAGLIWSVAELADVAVDLRALPVLVVCGALAILRPRSETEASAALSGLLASAAAIETATDQPTALAIHLTVAGALVTLSSLVHPDRRLLAWPGGALLALATWVRLADLGVEAPEAYTLPSAVVLVAVALYRIWRTPRAASAALLPGLTLATVPSLLWVLVDPVSPRAVMLGVACFALVLGGAQLRWSAPLVVGALVGGLLVIREVAPYASTLPQWVLIGVAGTALTVVGVTWEHRVLELRRTSAYLGRLR